MAGWEVDTGRALPARSRETRQLSIYYLSPILVNFIFLLCSGSTAENGFSEISFEVREHGVLNTVSNVWTKGWMNDVG
jgi:hypothetical protein